MHAGLAELLHLLELERLELNLFRGISRDIGSPQVFGGQVLGQALRAAYGTVDGQRSAHSLHAYFLRRGDFNAPIVYFVDRSRDGASFSSRRVTAIQHGEQIFNLSVSFQIDQPGVEHQAPMPQVPAPEALKDHDPVPKAILDAMPEKTRRLYASARPFEFRIVERFDPAHPKNAPPRQHIWMRAIDRLPDDDIVHRCLLAYLSDFYLLNTATLPHVEQLMSGRRFLASIDHAMWMHWPLRVDEWFLCAYESPSAAGSRGFSRGSIFARDGRLVAHTAQEGLMRVSDSAAAEPPR
ncbi:MAG TPA: acyl-CoA thioesterase II [Steroidobacteraceae bacterium]|jgi:acyl-CoA thioesterase-2